MGGATESGFVRVVCMRFLTPCMWGPGRGDHATLRRRADPPSTGGFGPCRPGNGRSRQLPRCKEVIVAVHTTTSTRGRTTGAIAARTILTVLGAAGLIIGA